MPNWVKQDHVCGKMYLDNNCPLCLDPIRNSTEQVIVLKSCGHAYHADCFDKNLESRDKRCLICRLPFVKEKKPPRPTRPVSRLGRPRRISALNLTALTNGTTLNVEA